MGVAKEHPLAIATALFACLVIGAFGGRIYVTVSEERVALLEQQTRTLQSDSAKQKKINKVIMEEVAVLRTGFKKLPETIQNVKGAFQGLLSDNLLKSGRKEEIENLVLVMMKDIDSVRKSLNKSDILSKTFDVFLSAITAEGNKDFETAARLYAVAAKDGNPNAQFRLGTLFAQGKGVAQDYNEAIKWYKIAAYSGVVGAQAELATAYLEGVGMDKNREQALAWFQIVSDTAPICAESKLVELRCNFSKEQLATSKIMTEKLKQEIEEL